MAFRIVYSSAFTQRDTRWGDEQRRGGEIMLTHMAVNWQGDCDD